MDIKNVQEFYALSPLQKDILFDSLESDDSGSFCGQFVCELHGDLNITALEAAWQQVVDHHSMLRTFFVWKRLKQPQQLVRKQLKFSLERSTITEQVQLEGYLKSDRLQGFDLSQAPLIRVTVCQNTPDMHWLICTYHCLVLDCNSLHLILKQVLTCYEAFCQGQKIQLEQSGSYRHYISWMEQQDVVAAETFWHRYLKGFSAPTVLGIERTAFNHANQVGGYRQQQLKLSKEITAELQFLASEYQLSLCTILHAAWALLLNRYSQEEEVIFGTTFSKRSLGGVKGLEQIVGSFVNTLPLRVRVSEDTEVLDWLKSLQSQLVEIKQYQYSSPSQIREWGNLPRELYCFQSAVFIDDLSLDEGSQKRVFGSINVCNIQSFESKNVPLRFEVEFGSDLTLQISYDRDRFSSNAIARMLQHLHTLLKGMVVQLDQPLSKLSLLSEKELHQVLFEWNNTFADYPQHLCIHQLFEAQEERSPDSIAVVFEDEYLTYRELNTRANQLAHHLQALGVGPEVLVGICMERSLQMIIGLLSILKAGGAYLPLDPTYPFERLSFMLEDAQPPVLLTQEQLLEELPSHWGQVVCLDSDQETITQKSEQNPSSEVTPNHLAYVIYTSGSTGTPKGVLVTHQGLCNLATTQISMFDVQPSSRILQFASLSFDASIWEIVMALCSGASLHLGTSDSLTPGQNLMDLLHQHSISHATLPPSALAVLPTEQLPALQNLIVAGEACSSDLVAKWSREQRFFNAYGPTESTVCATVALCTDDNSQPSIGRPISNTQIYILNRHLQPVPIEVPGELYIGGVSLARGYLNRPDLTNEKFILNPFSNEPDAYLYKTGDLARYLNDGQIEFIGRIDHQVKIRGFRIELAEIETVLRNHPSVDQSVAIVREDVPGDKRLVVYLVAKQPAPTVNDLRSFLKETLPDYMIPSIFVILDTLPLTANGKIDRRALPAPQAERSDLLQTFVAPTTAIEEILAQIWADILRVERVGIYDNFFELGGDSILSIQVIAKANQAGLKLIPKQLIKHQTIAELAAVVGETQITLAEQGIVTGKLPLTPIQHWFFQQNFPHPSHWNQSVLLEVQPDFTPAIAEQLLHQLLLHHDALRLRCQKLESGWQQYVSLPEETVPLSVFDFSSLEPPAQKSALQATAAGLQSSLNLQTGPIIRVGFFVLGDGQPHRLLIVIHHLAVDGFSWRILLEDLQVGYQQLLDGQELKLPPKTSSFQLWAERLAEYARSGAHESELDYWRCTQPPQPLPTDFVGGANTVESASAISVCLSPQQTRTLLQDVPRAYKTQINDVLLCALLQVLCQWSGDSSLVLDLEGHGREDIFADVDNSRTVGWFTSVFPVVLELSHTDDVGECLTAVKQQLRAIPHKGVGYGLLRYLHPDAQLVSGLDCLQSPQVSFNYLGQFDQVLPAGSIFRPASESAGGARHPLGHRTHLLEINALIVDDKLQIDWIYSRHFHEHGTIDSLANRYVQALGQLVAHCLSDQVGGFSPADFPLAQLSQKQLEHLLQSLKEQSTTLADGNHLKNIADIYPLSPTQQGLLFHTLYAPDSGVYFEQLSCTLSNSLNIEEFELAWQQVVARHSVLRTALFWSGLEQPVQVIFHRVQLPLAVLDWRSLSASQQQQQLSAFILSDRQRGFILSQAPLMRLTLIRLDDDTYQFIWSHHHILLDGWSVFLVIKEVLAYYEARNQASNLHLEESVSYREHIAWLQKQDQTAAEAFWRQLLKGITAPTPLVVDEAPSRLSGKEIQQTEKQIQLSAATTANLQSFVREHQLTLSILVQGAWALLLNRYSGETDVVFGVTVSGRSGDIPGVESMVGLLINTLPTRISIHENDTTLSWLKQIQQQQVEIAQYEYSSLAQVQEWSEVRSGSPLFESILVFENYPVDTALREHNFNLHARDVHALEKTNYPLTVVLVPAKQLAVRLYYDSSRFDAATIEHMLGHFQTLLEGIIATPDQYLSKIPILSAAEQQQLLVEWNDTKTNYPNNLCLHQMFEAQVERTPDAVALVFVDQSLTYRELNNRANQLAHHLQALGVQPDVLIGLCVERTPEMIVGMLAILKSGGAYVPLDPVYPDDRLAFMLNDSQVSVLLTQEHLVEKLPQHNAKTVCLDLDFQAFSNYSEENPISNVRADNLVYVMYTSGSTGKPKGIAIQHRSAIALVHWAKEIVASEDLAGVLASTSMCFDPSIFELFVTLSYGGRLILSENILHLPVLLAANQVTMINTVPSAIAELLKVNGIPASVRTIYLAGEALQNRLVQEIYQQQTIQQVFNLYGPTEDTIYSTFALVRQGTSQPISIGSPIGNTQVYLLDSQMQPTPIGVPGQLYIAGDGLARSYFNRPDLTAERFVPNPFDQDKGTRLYKTGDLVRYRSDGNIEFLGRIDNQVKIRGFRIELGEIETILVEHPQVQSAVVIAREDQPGSKRLVSYVVPKQDLALTESELRHFLQQKLPEYMVPSAFVLLDILPLTPNGKLDRRALPLPATSNITQELHFIPPRDIVELQLAQIWEEILDVYPIGINDNFFDKGGNSLLVLRLMANIQQQFQQNLPLAILFHSPTVAELATILRSSTDFSNWSSLVKIQSGGSLTPIFCIHPAGGNVLCYYDLAHYLGPEQPFYGLEAVGLDGQQEPLTTVENAASYFIRALQTIQPSGPYQLAGWSYGGLVAYEMASQLVANGEQVTILALIDSQPATQSETLEFETDDARRLINLMQGYFSVTLKYPEELNPDERLLNVMEQLKQANLIPPDFALTQARSFLKVHKTNVQAAMNYSPKHYPGRVMLFRASESNEEVLAEPTMGWQALADNGVDLYMVPGTHQTMLQKPNVQGLAEKLKHCLEQVQAEN